MGQPKLKIRTWLLSFESIAVAAAAAGLVFMFAVLVIVLRRYDLTESFNPELNSHIGTFVASVAGTLFALTNALLLYATLKTQRLAHTQSELQHVQLVRDSNYTKIYGRLQAIGTAIAQYQVVDSAGIRPHELNIAPRHLYSYEAWEHTFSLWFNACLPHQIKVVFDFGERLQPDRFLTHQALIIDTFMEIRAVRQDLALDLDEGARKYLTNSLDTIVARLATSREHIQGAKQMLRKVIAEGIPGKPKQEYSSDLLHIIAQLDLVLDQLPLIPYKRLSPYEPRTFVFTSSNVELQLKCDKPISLQIDKVEFETKDEDWALRFNLIRVIISIEVSDRQGRSLHSRRQAFGLGLLLHNTTFKTTSFETQGQWWVEGDYNLNSALEEEHVNWTLAAWLEYSPLGNDKTTDALLDGESMNLHVKTNGVSMPVI